MVSSGAAVNLWYGVDESARFQANPPLVDIFFTAP
jgi:hypothetical protein